MDMRDKCLKALFREFCGMKVGLRRAVIIPVSWISDIRRIAKALEIRPAPVFFSIPYEIKKSIDVAIFSLDYSLIGELAALLFDKWIVEEGDAMLGELCGIPKCCVNAYLNGSKRFDHEYHRYKEQCAGGEPYDIEMLEDKEGWLWIFGGISHIPCSPTCEETENLAENYRSLCVTCKKQICKFKILDTEEVE